MYMYHLPRVHNKVLRSCLPTYFSLLIQPSCPFLGKNPDTTIIFTVILI